MVDQVATVVAGHPVARAVVIALDVLVFASFVVELTFPVGWNQRVLVSTAFRFVREFLCVHVVRCVTLDDVNIMPKISR